MHYFWSQVDTCWYLLMVDLTSKEWGCSSSITLVIPHLEVNPVWKDSSSFEEIFDADSSINSLKDDVSIIKVLPKEFSWSTREYYGTGVRATRIKTAPLHASANWYMENASSILCLRKKMNLHFLYLLWSFYTLWMLLVSERHLVDL